MKATTILAENKIVSASKEQSACVLGLLQCPFTLGQISCHDLLLFCFKASPNLWDDMEWHFHIALERKYFFYYLSVMVICIFYNASIPFVILFQKNMHAHVF